MFQLPTTILLVILPCAPQATLISRLRLDARLFAFAQLKSQATFSDLLALVSRTIWADANHVKSAIDDDQGIISPRDWERVLSPLASTA